MTNDPTDPDSDPFGPPVISTIVECIHCGEQYDSFRIERRVEPDADGKPQGFWCCPMPGCDGIGFGFDIFPIDPEYRDENGELMWHDDDEEYDDDELLFEDDGLIDEFSADEFKNTNGAHHEEELPFGKRRAGTAKMIFRIEAAHF